MQTIYPSPPEGQFDALLRSLSHPLMYALLSNEIEYNRHGPSVSLRNTVVRLGSIITPAVMGVAAEAYGIENSFYVIGGVFLLATAGLAVTARKLH